MRIPTNHGNSPLKTFDALELELLLDRSESKNDFPHSKAEDRWNIL